MSLLKVMISILWRSVILFPLAVAAYTLALAYFVVPLSWIFDLAWPSPSYWLLLIPWAAPIYYWRQPLFHYFGGIDKNSNDKGVV